MEIQTLTLDANIFIAALKTDEKYSEKCAEILRIIPDRFILSEPSIIYQEVCGTLARRVGIEAARRAEKLLDTLLYPELVIECDRKMCKEAYELCHEYEIYAVDALYLKTAIETKSSLISLDKEHFIDKIKQRKPPVKAYHISEFKFI